jgi:hypothetical protein
MRGQILSLNRAVTRNYRHFTSAPRNQANLSSLPEVRATGLLTRGTHEAKRLNKSGMPSNGEMCKCCTTARACAFRVSALRRVLPIQVSIQGAGEVDCIGSVSQGNASRKLAIIATICAPLWIWDLTRPSPARPGFLYSIYATRSAARISQLSRTTEQQRNRIGPEHRIPSPKWD